MVVETLMPQVEIMKALNDWLILPDDGKQEVEAAIVYHISNGFPISELECLGLEERVINTLERNGISCLEELVSKSINELNFNQLGPRYLKNIIAALCKLPEFEKHQEKHMKKLCPNREDIEKIRLFGLESVVSQELVKNR